MLWIVDSEANGGAAAATPAEGEQPKDTLFSSMKFQMPSWLSKKENKEEDGAKEAKPVTPEAEPKEKPMEEQAAVEGAEGENKEGFTGKLIKRFFFIIASSNSSVL